MHNQESSEDQHLYYGGSLKDYLDKEEKKEEPENVVH